MDTLKITLQVLLNFGLMYFWIIFLTPFRMVKPKMRQSGQVLEKACVHSRDHIFGPLTFVRMVFMPSH